MYICIHVLSGADPRFSDGGGGGAQKNARLSAHEHEEQNPLRLGSKACLRTVEALGFLMLACYLSLILKHSDTNRTPPPKKKKKKKWFKIKMFFYFGKGGEVHIAPPPPPPPQPTCRSATGYGLALVE